MLGQAYLVKLEDEFSGNLPYELSKPCMIKCGERSELWPSKLLLVEVVVELYVWVCKDREPSREKTMFWSIEGKSNK